MSSIQARNVNHPAHRQNLKAEKYKLIREAMLAVLPLDEWMTFNALEERVRAWLQENGADPSYFPKAGSVRWYTKTVQLDLEARGEIERLTKKSPLHLRRRIQNDG